MSQGVLPETKRSPDEELQDILMGDRKRLPDFLEKHGDYSNLVDLVKKIEAKNPTEPDIWKKLMMGKKTLPGQDITANLKRALYEMPTKELLHVINFLLLIFNIKEVNELAAGQGLLTTLLQRKFKTDGIDIKISASDSLTWTQTSDTTTYQETKIQRQSIYDFTNELYDTRRLRFAKKAVIISWIYKTFEEELLDLMREKSTNLYIIIGEGIGKSCMSAMTHYKIAQLGYKIIRLPVLQMCYNDYFLANEVHSEDTCRSQVTLITNPNCTFTSDELINFCGISNFAPKFSENLTEKEVIQDLCVDNIIPRWISKLDETKMKKACVTVSLVHKYRHIFPEAKVPDWVLNQRELTFWISKKILKKFPVLITDNTTLNTYMNLLENLRNNLSKYKTEGKLPVWIRTEELAEQYFWIDFSTPDTDKTWKDSEAGFNEKFTLLYGNHTEQQFENSLFTMLGTGSATGSLATAFEGALANTLGRSVRY